MTAQTTKEHLLRRQTNPGPARQQSPQQTKRGRARRRTPSETPARWRGLVLPLALVALWWAAAHGGWSSSPMLVAPEKVLATAVDQIVTGKLARALEASLARELTGFAIGTVLGLALGGFLGLSRYANRLIGPSFNTFKQISLFAWIPLISVWFGLGDTAKVVFLSLAALVPVVVNTCDGIRNTPTRLLEVARAYGYTRLQTIWSVVLPAAVPAIFTGIFLALIYSWLATIGAEYLLVAGFGIGNTLIDGSEHFQMDLVIFGMVVIGMVGWIMNAGARVLERRLSRWRAA